MINVLQQLLLSLLCLTLMIINLYLKWIATTHQFLKTDLLPFKLVLAQMRERERERERLKL